MCELLWTDPQEDNGRGPSKRGKFEIGLFDEIGGLQICRRGHWIRSRCNQKVVRAEWDHWVSRDPWPTLVSLLIGNLSILRSHEVRQGL